MKLYKDKEWLYKRYITDNLSSIKIAEEVGVTKRTILNYLRKFGIEKPKEKTFANRRKKIPLYVELNCSNCGEQTQKTARYYKARIRVGKTEFYCSRDCADDAHSRKMEGSGNPNHGGKWHAPCPSTWSEEKRRAAARKTRETMLREGTSRGKRNGRWAGGFKAYDCVICEKSSLKPPYVSREIDKGERQPTCSNECATALSRRNMPTKFTSIEIAMAEELSRRGIKYDEQYNLGDKFRLDFLLPEYGIVIECDGDYWHNLPEVKSRDSRKNAYIKACGYSLYRFWESEIKADVGACVDIVLAEINEREAIV